MASIHSKIDDLAETCRALEAGRSGQIRVMEVCGTHTVSIARSGMRKLLPSLVRLISGPGCPVCVTDGSYVDLAVRVARGDGLPAAPIVATYGDMVRVPGTEGSLAEARAAGAAVAVVYSADQAVELAIKESPREVVFLGVGFETTAPATALAILRAKKEGARNFSVLAAHKLMMPALRALLAEEIAIDAFLCPGHVSVILGYGVYEEIAQGCGKPCVIAGFEPAGILDGVNEIVRQLARGKPAATTVYPPVTREGNRAAQRMLDEVFMPSDAAWRALGVIPGSGLAIRPELGDFDAARKFSLHERPAQDDPRCRCGMVITGRLTPRDCPLFASRCTPRDPVGPCMVSSEGACAAAYKYERLP
jgi:hydrogenase expression/formation protein HypD